MARSISDLENTPNLRKWKLRNLLNECQQQQAVVLKYQACQIPKFWVSLGSARPEDEAIVKNNADIINILIELIKRLFNKFRLNDVDSKVVNLFHFSKYK